MSAPELKPCPFCGASVSLEKAEVGRNPKEWWGVVCRGTKNLGGTCAIQQRASRTKEAAITRWNTRADLAPAAPKVKALVWVELARGLFGATTPFGCYHVWEGHYQAPCDKMGQPALDPRSEAQADYEARILAALEEQ